MTNEERIQQLLDGLREHAFRVTTEKSYFRGMPARPVPHPYATSPWTNIRFWFFGNRVVVTQANYRGVHYPSTGELFGPLKEVTVEQMVQFAKERPLLCKSDN